MAEDNEILKNAITDDVIDSTIDELLDEKAPEDPKADISYNYTEENILDKVKKKITDSVADISGVIGGLKDSKIATDIAESFYNITQTIENKIELTKENISDTIQNVFVDNIDGTSKISNTANLVESAVTNALGAADSWIEGASDTIGEWADAIGDVAGGSSFMGTLSSILKTISDGTTNYKDGVSETSFGRSMDSSWYGSNTKSFLNYFQKKNSSVAIESRRINILNNTPLDSEATGSQGGLYGTMMLGAPFLFNRNSDPTNRTLINTFIKDGKFVSFTPGLPKFNGTSYDSGNDNILTQTKSPEAMLNYLTKNGLDRDFADKDKRYYTFKTDYAAYFAYLETMLNTVWVKMGLAKNGNSFNLFSFFNIKNENASGGLDPSKYEALKSQFNSSIGFFSNVSSAVSESISNSSSSHGDALAERANSNAREYQNINYITGMGTGSSLKNLSRKTAIGFKSASQIGSLVKDTFSSTAKAFSDFKDTWYGGKNIVTRLISKVAALASIPLSIANDISTFNTTQDLGSIIQSFATANGMMVKYPNLWEDSSYSKNINFNFSFVSPYGDPYSIFKYVYVPFFALLAFAMPRQAAENGYVSPFLVRCDVPGLITSDLALISDITWTKGGAQALWTKDGLPRAIDCTITVQDLYPYLAMSKRISFLSANPSYSVFLDSLSGMLSINDGTEDDALNAYFKELINRVNGERDGGNTMWNKFNSTKSAKIKEISEKVRSSVSATVDPHAIPWLHNSSIT